MNGNSENQVRHATKQQQQNGYYPMPPSNGNGNSKNRPNFNGQRAGWTGSNGERDNTLSVSSDRIPSAIKVSRASSRNSFASEDLERYMQPGKPVPPPRVTPLARQPSGTNRILSGRSQDSSFPHIYETPPPVKPRKLSVKSSSYTNMNVDGDESNIFVILKKKQFFKMIHFKINMQIIMLTTIMITL